MAQRHALHPPPGRHSRHSPRIDVDDMFQEDDSTSSVAHSTTGPSADVDVGSAARSSLPYTENEDSSNAQFVEEQKPSVRKGKALSSVFSSIVKPSKRKGMEQTSYRPQRTNAHTGSRLSPPLFATHTPRQNSQKEDHPESARQPFVPTAASTSTNHNPERTSSVRSSKWVCVEGRSPDDVTVVRTASLSVVSAAAAASAVSDVEQNASGVNVLLGGASNFEDHTRNAANEDEGGQEDEDVKDTLWRIAEEEEEEDPRPTSHAPHARANGKREEGPLKERGDEGSIRGTHTTHRGNCRNDEEDDEDDELLSNLADNEAEKMMARFKTELEMEKWFSAFPATIQAADGTRATLPPRTMSADENSSWNGSDPKNCECAPTEEETESVFNDEALTAERESVGSELYTKKGKDPLPTRPCSNE